MRRTGTVVAKILIDGYNLIGIQHGNIEAERERLIGALSRYRKLRSHEITVVFDGWRGGGVRATRISTGGVTVIYSPLGQKADALMADMLARDSAYWIVVSSDREVEASAWAGDSVPVNSDTFMGILERAIGATPGGGAGAPQDYAPDIDEDEYDEALYGRPGRKGNPFKPSRKQKAIERAIKKL